MKKKFKVSIICMILLVSVMATALPTSATTFSDNDSAWMYNTNNDVVVCCQTEITHDDATRTVYGSAYLVYLESNYSMIPVYTNLYVQYGDGTPGGITGSESTFQGRYITDSSDYLNNNFTIPSGTYVHNAELQAAFNYGFTIDEVTYDIVQNYEYCINVSSTITPIGN